jgi:DNA-binding MarR family transcriptional regulator
VGVPRVLALEVLDRASADDSAALRTGVARSGDPLLDAASAPGDRPPSVALLLFSAYRIMEKRVFAALSGAGFGDVTPAQARLFRGIGHHGSRLTELATTAHVTKQTAGFLVEQLERAGYVTRVADPDDARARLVKIAPKGAAALPIAAAAVAEVEAEWAASIGSESMARLRETLLTLWDLTEPPR